VGAERTLKRRFTDATGFAPIDYVQRLRVEDVKRRLERTDASADEIGWQVGYDDPAFFRRLIKRVTGLAPGAYRKRFQMPASPGLGAANGLQWVGERVREPRKRQRVVPQSLVWQMAASISDRLWNFGDIVGVVEAWERQQKGNASVLDVNACLWRICPRQLPAAKMLFMSRLRVSEARR
jgi:Helix-turn-helix domain